MLSAKILIVEDEARVALDLSRQLETLGYQVCGTADNGLDAVDLANQHRPDLVLMDIVLKGTMDGIEASRLIGQVGQIPVIFLTDYSDKATVERAAQSAPYGYLTKPFQPRELQAAIEIALYKAAAIRQLLDSEQQLTQLAHYDPLTGLSNRTKLMERAEHEIQAAKRLRLHLGVLYLDLDRFKPVNDVLGHAVGDQLLQAVGQRLLACTRATDCVARLGGDEFVVLLPGLHGAEEVTVVADKIIAAITQPITLGEHTVSIGISLGAAIYPEDGGDVAILLQRADTALYQAKADGRGLLCFYRPEWTARTLARQRQDQQLRRALAQDGLELNYQPLVALTDGHLVGAEALIRWRHPDGRLLPASDFLPQAAQTPLMPALDDWALHAACREAAGWGNGNGQAPSVAVNVSSRQFQSGQLVASVERSLTASGLVAHRLCLELTETTLLQGGDIALTTLAALKALGVEIAIDNFGVGCSSLGLLQRVHPDKLKIDRSLVQNLPQRQDTPPLVAAIIAMAHHLGIQVIAEGVETSGQSTTLMDEGCDSAQGYWYAAPCSAADFRHYLSSYGAAPQ